MSAESQHTIFRKTLKNPETNHWVKECIHCGEVLDEWYGSFSKGADL